MSEPSQLIEQLATAAWSVRRGLIAALAEPQALEPLLAALRTRRDDETRIAALVDALVGSAGPVEDALAELALDPDPAIVADVAQVLGRRRNARAVPTLIALTQHADDNVAVAAIEGLGRIGGPRAVDALITCVRSGNFFRVFPAIDVLGRTGDPRAIEPLAELLGNSRYVYEAARALGRSADRAAITPLLGLLTSASEASLRVACAALAELVERHQELYGSSTTLLEPLRQLCSERLLRRLAQALPAADKTEKIALCRLLGALESGLAVDALLGQLDADADVARAASAALKQIGRDSERAVGEALTHASSARRAALLPGITHTEHTDAVRACLRDPEPNVRALAAQALARLGAREATSDLFALLEDAQPRVVHAATAAISALGSEQTEPLALHYAASSALEARRAALRVLGYFGYPSGFDALRTALFERDQRLRDAAAAGLAMLEDPRARPLLCEAAADPDAKLRAAAIRALGQAEANEQALATLRGALGDEDAWVRYYACQALGRLRAQDALEEVRGLLEDGAGQVRVAAVEALSHLPGEAALAALRMCAQSPDQDMQRAALLGLGMRADAGSFDTFLGALHSTDPATRLVALSALANDHGAATERALIHAAHDQDESVRSAAIGYLQAAPGAGASEALVELAREGIERPRALSALALPHPARVEALLSGLANADDELAPLLSSCLAKLGGGAARDGLIAALGLDNRAARMAAAHALAALGTREAFAALSQAAAHDPDADVQRVCALHLMS
ncbi:MAG TPA: HEAT repeat domain-containing protein [Polyangiales bacterium]